MTNINITNIIKSLQEELVQETNEATKDLKLAISLLENYDNVSRANSGRTAEQARSEASAAFQSREYDTAATLFSEAIKLAPSDARNFTNRAACYLHMANADCLTATKIDPGFSRAFTRRAHISIAQGKWEEAEDCLRSAKDISTDAETVKLLEFVQGYRNPRIRNETSATDSLDYDVVGSSLVNLLTHPKVGAALSKFSETYQNSANASQAIQTLSKEYPRLLRLNPKDPKYDDIFSKLKHAQIDISDSLSALTFFKFEQKYVQDYLTICKELADAMNIDTSSKSSSMFM